MKKLLNILLFIQLHFYRVLSFFMFSIRKPTKEVLYLSCFYPGNSGYHWRAHKWAIELRKEGLNVDVLHPLNEQEFRDYNNNPPLFLMRFLHRRFWQVVKARKYKTVIVRREVLLFNEYGNIFMEKLLRKLCNQLILDIDDDLAAAKRQPYEIQSLYGRLMLENGNSFRNSLRYYDKFFVASSYLREYVKKYTDKTDETICIIPTCVDYDRYESKLYGKGKKVLTLGWIGGDHNYYLIHAIIPLLNRLFKKHHFHLLVIGGQPFSAETDFNIINKKWSLNTEVEDLLTIDIGLMPLTFDDISKGKGAFKLIQYMGLGIVSVASPITINKEIVDHEKNSFLALSDEEWHRQLEGILEGKYDLSNIGDAARKTILENYMFSSNQKKYLNFITNKSK